MLSSEQRRGERAGERGDGEDDEAGLGDAPVADDLPEGGERQQRDEDRHLVGVDDPDRGRRRDGKSRAIEGSATFTIVLSSTDIDDRQQDRRDRPSSDAARAGRQGASVRVRGTRDCMPVRYIYEWAAVVISRIMAAYRPM